MYISTNPSLISSIKNLLSRVSITLDRIVLPRTSGLSVDAKCLCISTGPPAGTVARIGHHSGTHTHTHANGHDHDLGKGQARVSHSSSLFISSSTRPIHRKLPNQKHGHT